MFDQTFINGRQDARRPYVIILSLLLQIAAMCLFIAIPLIYSEALPSAQLKSILTAPSALVPAPPHIVARTRLTSMVRPFIAPREIALSAILKKVNPIEGVPPALAIGVASSTGDEQSGGGDMISNIISSKPNAPPLPVNNSKAHRGPVRVGGHVAQANLIRQIQPVYPPLARSARVQGSVEFTAIIGKNGEIENLQLIHGHPLLVAAAREAVLNWRYRPTLLNGQPVEVLTDIVVNFTLNP
jgi:protein TonB